MTDQKAAPPQDARGCTVPPEGWYCTREGGHDGPCAAWLRYERLSERWQELFWALPTGEFRHKLRSLEIDIGRALRRVPPPPEGEALTGGQVLYMALAKRLIGRIMDADDSPEMDVELALARIITERNELRAHQRGAPEGEALREALKEAVQTARNYFALWGDATWKARLNRWEEPLRATAGAPAPSQKGQTPMDKRMTGLFHKFNVERTDGTSAPGQKHDGCDYFVLDLTHDPHAPAAIRAYADSCEADYPLLARDLRAKTPGAPAPASPTAGRLICTQCERPFDPDFPCRCEPRMLGREAEGEPAPSQACVCPEQGTEGINDTYCPIEGHAARGRQQAGDEESRESQARATPEASRHAEPFCPACGRVYTHMVPIGCPDGRPGCLVGHYRYVCPCGADVQVATSPERGNAERANTERGALEALVREMREALANGALFNPEAFNFKDAVLHWADALDRILKGER